MNATWVRAFTRAARAATLSAAVVIVSFTVGAPAAPAANGTAAASAKCAARDGLHFICGIDSPEDLVQVGQTSWVLTSGMGPHGGMYLLKADRGLWKQVFPGVAVPEKLDSTRFSSCSGPPDAAHVSMLGLAIRPTPAAPQVAGMTAAYMLYGVDAGRNAIEVFKVHLQPTPSFGGGPAVVPPPRLTWIGCVMLPAGTHARGVTATRNGTIFASVPARPGMTMAEAFAGKPTGAVYEWKPGNTAFHELKGTELPGDSGVEISNDDQTLFVVAAGSMQVDAFSIADPSHPLRVAHLQGFHPDGLHWDGKDLVTAGMRAGGSKPACLSEANGHAADCHAGYVAARIDPMTMSATVFSKSGPNPAYGDISLALPVAHHIWYGSLRSDRLAYRSM